MKNIYIPVKSRQACRKVYIDDILYIFQRGRITTICTENYETSFYSKLSDLEKYLTNDFVYVLKYSVINFKKVERAENGILYFNNGSEFKDIGISNFIKAKQLFINYMFNSAQIYENSKDVELSTLHGVNEEHCFERNAEDINTDIYIPVTSRKFCRKVYVNKVLYMVQRGRITTIRTEDYEVNFYAKLSDLKKYLNKDFVSILKHCVVNFEKVERLETNSIIFKNGIVLNSFDTEDFIKVRQHFITYLFKTSLFSKRPTLKSKNKK